MWRAPDHTRLVFDLSGPLDHRLSELKNPDRLVIDLENARLDKPLPSLDFSGPLVRGVRSGQRDFDTLRVVLDLKNATRPRAFLLKPYGQYGHRLVIDLYDVDAARQEQQQDRLPAAAIELPSKKREWVIAIDAGHGGEDPGAIGRRYRTYEKTVVLAIARELKKLVRADPAMRPVMIRNGDYYARLSDRWKKAHRNQADIFISIHADALPSRRAVGSSVYVLSDRGASNAAAKYLADKENAADLIGGVDLSGKDDMLVKVLMDLSQTATISDSLELGADVLAKLRQVGPLHISKVAQAGFAVLKSPSIPSILVETAFISNPAEERKLRSRAYQRKLARGIYNGVKKYISRRQHPRAPRRHLVDGKPREHIVKRGETLSHIARKYNIKIDALKFANNLRNSDIRAGFRLRIP